MAYMLRSVIICAMCLFFGAKAHSADYFSKQELVTAKKTFQAIKKKRYSQARSYAATLRDPVFLKLVTWFQYRSHYKENSYETIATFIEKNPDWPSLKHLRNRAEDALVGKDIPPQKIVSYFKNTPPITGDAMKLLAEAMIQTGGNQQRIDSLLKQAWQQGDFSYEVEKDFLRKHKKRLTQTDHIARIDRLLWEDKITRARRLFPYISKEYKALFNARITLMRNASGVDKAIKAVPDALLQNSGFVYERASWHHRRKSFRRVYDYIKNFKGEQPFQEKWWDVKNRLIRELIDKKEYKAAYHIARHHGNASGTVEYAEGNWLAGWLALSFLDKPSEAYEFFYQMYHHVSYPISRARAAYWAARAAQASNKDDVANAWYVIASKYPTVFYGQLALAKLNTPLSEVLRFAKDPDNSRYDALTRHNEQLKAAHMLLDVGYEKTAGLFIEAAIDAAHSNEERVAIASFGYRVGNTMLSLESAKYLLYEHQILSRHAYPVLGTMPESEVEDALVLAVIRQESRFDISARSSANAKGLMQILPATARRIARKNRIRYVKSKLLHNPLYNVRLGSLYLDHLMDYQDDSYILTLASYNAGPSNVKRWKKRYGDPRTYVLTEQIVDWLESIPFYETRNYVQRVLENKQLYQYITAQKELTIVEDMIPQKKSKLTQLIKQ